MIRLQMTDAAVLEGDIWRLIEELNDGTSNLSDIFSYLEEIFSDTSSIVSSLAEIFGVGLVVLTMILSAAAAFFTLLVYIFKGIGIFRMARKVGHPCPFLAWIPFVNTYMAFTLPGKPYQMLVFRKPIQNRTVGFVIWLIVLYCFDLILSLLLLLTPVPVIGVLIDTVLAVIKVLYVPLKIFLRVCVVYPMYRDLYAMFLTDEKAKTNAVISLICCFVCPVGTALIDLIVSTKPLRADALDPKAA